MVESDGGGKEGRVGRVSGGRYVCLFRCRGEDLHGGSEKDADSHALLAGGWYKIHQTAGRTSQSVDFDDPANKPYFDKLKALWGTFRSTSVGSSLPFVILLLSCVSAAANCYGVMQWNFTIPASTPAGQYLVRWENIFPNPEDAQFYVNCAHIEVTNDKTGVEPSQEYKVKIPGVYTRGQKGMYLASRVEGRGDVR